MDQAEAPNTPAIAPECPRPAPIDWSAVRVLAVAVGVRESARRLGISEEAVKKRCTREGWLDDPNVREVARKSVQERSVSSIVPKVSPMAAMAQELAGLGQKTRIGIARGLARASEVVSEMQGVQVIDNAHEIKSVTQTASIIHGWDKTSVTPRIRLELTGNRSENVVVDIESEVLTDQTTIETD